jgi:hypothetical protein
MRRVALALAALTATTLAVAQQTTPPTTTGPQTSTTSQEQAAPRADSKLHLSEADKQTLMGDCTRQVRANNPNVSEKDIKVYCTDAVKNYVSAQ